VPNTVVAEAAVDMGLEWRTFNKEKRVKTAPLRLVVETDMVVKAEHGARWRRLAKFHRETLHSYERRLAKIGGELKRVSAPVCLNTWRRRLRRL
jgi:transcription initiation factor TFIIIB Brf1 subunit/transcription initiation factor TFIIB